MTTEHAAPLSRHYVFTEHGGPETEALLERAVPEPGRGELLVEVRAAGVNPADWKLREGLFGRVEVPRTLGFEVAGTVLAVGHGVEEYAVGDEVLGSPAPGEGGYADHTLIRAGDAVRKPGGVPFPVAATLPVAGTTAYDLTHAVEVEPGQTMLVLGAGGGVGSLAAQIGRARQLQVIGVASMSKREIVEATGAQWVAAGDGVVAAVREIAPDAVHLLLDLVGGRALRDVAELAVSPERIISAADGDTVAELGGTYRPSRPDALEQVTAMVAAGQITPQVTHEFPLEHARRALALVESGHAEGKTVIVPR